MYSSGPEGQHENEVDTLSYMMGVSNSQGLKEYATGRLGVDTAYMADFIRGIEQGTKEVDAKQKAYLAGMQIGQQISGEMFEAINNQLFRGDSTQTLSKENFLAGFISAVSQKSMVSADSAQMYVRERAEAIQAKALEAQYADYIKENKAFLEANKTKEGVQTTPSGLQYKVITKVPAKSLPRHLALR